LSAIRGTRPCGVRRASAKLAAVSLAGVLAVALPGCAAASRAAGAAATGPARDGDWSTTTDHFCSDAQRVIANSRVAAVNTVYTDRNAFVSSKASARPLETRQYAAPEAPGGTRPKMVSCKMKTADHIRTEHGADQAGADESCASLNQRTLDAVLASLTRGERRRQKFGGAGGRIVVDADEVVDNGGDWLRPFAIARLETDGTLHLQAKGMNKGWLDPRYASAETKHRGVRYCHLVAPEYLRRLVLGEIVP